MINLLPSDIKKSHVYGRRNKAILRWVFMCLIGIAALGGIAGGGYFFINNAEQSARHIKTQTEVSIENAKLSTVEKEYAAFSSNLRLVTQILGKQVLFSELIRQIGSVTPNGATLNAVSLSDKDNALNLDFKTNTATVAATVQVNLEDPKNELFEKADIISLNCQRDETNGQETCLVQLRALFRDSAEFLFLNSISKGAGQ